MKNGGEFIYEVLSGRLCKIESTEAFPLCYLWCGFSYELTDNHEIDENGVPVPFVFSTVQLVPKIIVHKIGMSNPQWCVSVDGVRWRLSHEIRSIIYFSDVQQAIECCEKAMAKRFRIKRGRNVILPCDF